MTRNDADLARDIATEAGEVLMRVRDARLLSGDALGDAGDRLANAFILDALKAARPDDAILSEEAADDPARLVARRVWIVDPLDGTHEYKAGRDDWAVHVALGIDGVASVGAVALPVRGLTLTTGSPPRLPPPARLSPTHLTSIQAPRMLISRTRPPPIAVAVAEQLGAPLIPMGSAGAKAMAIVLGDGDIYLHDGGMHQWDSCAPVAVALAAGLHASRIDGSPLVYNAADTSMPDLLVCRREHAARVLALVAELG